MPGTRIPTLSELFALVGKSGNNRVRFNIETKIDPNHPDESLDPQAFVMRLLALIEAEKFSDRVMIQSFDWRTLQLVQQRAPAIPTVYLTLQRGGGTPPLIAERDALDSWHQSGRSWRLAATHDQSGWRCGVVALFRRRHVRPGQGGA